MCEACGIKTSTEMGATTGAIPAKMLPWDGKKMAAQNTHHSFSDPASVQCRCAETLCSASGSLGTRFQGLEL